jgi:hypothetical protein
MSIFTGVNTTSDDEFDEIVYFLYGEFEHCETTYITTHE